MSRSDTVAMVGAFFHVTGIVQGVGFRPFVYGLAQRLDLTGWVRNTSSGVDIALEGTPAALEAFTLALRTESPPLARIDAVAVTEQPANGYRRIEILASQAEDGAYQPISPDIAVCDDCLREMRDPSDRRYRYPFINCTNCGPRYTIILDIPYDRPQTTMSEFPMCPACEAEYHDPLDRRFHAQPTACPVCGPQVWLETTDGAGSIAGDDAIREARRLLKTGRILAIKGLGGFHLACDAANAAAVTELRRRKRRAAKPLAVMVADEPALHHHCAPTTAELGLLRSTARPIVIVPRNSYATITDEVAPGQDSVGVMLPYTPLHHLLLEREPGFPAALVMTSGNLSDEPIITTNEAARERLANLADAFLLHNRDIHTRCDDSVMRVATAGERGHDALIIRRARGYAPLPLRLPHAGPPLLACGAELKNTFCLTRDNQAFLSQHIGDLENYETLSAFEENVAHMERLFRIQPEAVAYDLHPDYMATRYALARAEREGLAAIAVQHHHAHIAAGMADEGLPGERPVIGLAFDGTGYGPDGAVWGGEFLLADYRAYERPFHLRYVALPGGDLAVREPWRMALAWLWSVGMDWAEDLAPVQFALSQGEERLRVLRRQLERGINAPMTSSMGRLFDAAAALVGVQQTASYEAQAAVEFEALVDPAETAAYCFAVGETTIDPSPVWQALIADCRAGVPVSRIAARLYNSVADVAGVVCRQLRQAYGLNQVVLSGGVWQNVALLQRVRTDLLEADFEVVCHKRVPPNDGGLSLGQAAIAASRLHT